MSPCIIGITCNCLSIFINDSNYIALKILDEVVGNVVVKDTANAVLVVIDGNKSISIPSFAEDLGTVKGVSMENTVDLLAGSDAVCVVGVLDIVKLLKLASLFPSQRMTEIIGRVALRIIGYRLTVIRGKEILPSIVAVYVADLGCFCNLAIFVNNALSRNVTVVVIRKLGSYAILGFGFKLTKCIVGVDRCVGYGSFVNRVGLDNRGNTLLGIVAVRECSAARENDLADKLSGFLN